MNENIINEICQKLNIEKIQVINTLKMLEEGNTIPFIARYRKELTKNLDEEQIKEINEVYTYQVNLLQRKEDVIRLIDEKGLLTDELKEKIMSSEKLVEVEDLYRPFKEKKKTKATEAIKNGLEPLAKMIMSNPTNGTIEQLSKKFINENVKTIEDAIQGASYIIAEYISDSASFRKWIRIYTYKNGIIVSKKKKDSKDDEKIYEMYYEYQEKIKDIKSHRILALNRAEKEKVLTVSIDVNKDEILSFLGNKIIKNENTFVKEILISSIKDAYTRLISPSIEREIRSELTDKADIVAIDNFAKNLESLLLTPPMKEKTVLALDPGFKNGCKLAVIDKFGSYLTSTVINPFFNEKEINNAKAVMLLFIKKYNVEIIAIGNGTASRESEKFCVDLIKENNLSCKYIIVSEAGASIYSTEKVASDEFPNLSPNERSAVSIGRRLQDPLAELVKIPPEGIGVGLYQHDVNNTKLKETLDFTVEKVVNNVGVNINTASPSLLKYVSGITKRHIDKILEYRNKKGKFSTREEIKKSKILSDNAYEQAIGFLRITEGENIFDQTAIHPESYNVAISLLNKINCQINEVGTKDLIDKLDKIDIEKTSKELNTDIYTLEDIIKSLKKPTRDPRDEMPTPILKSNILQIEDLKPGMKLQGTVRNVVDFGAFIDIGLHNDALVHISEITDKYIKDPKEILSVGQIIDCYVLDINNEKKKVSLTLKNRG